MQFSKKPHSPRPNVQEEKEGEHLEAGERKRKNTNSKNKKGNSFASLSTEEAEEHLASSSDDDDTGISVTATKGEPDVDEQLEAAEHVEEDKKPFDAATSLLIFHNGQVYVREDRDVVVENGGRALIRDLPSSVHPASLNFRSFTDSDASIVEHTLENGVDSFMALLAESVGEVVTLKLNDKEESSVRGKLLQIMEKEDVALETEEGAVVVISRAHIVSAEAGHQSFNKEPTLHCVVETNQEGAHKAQLTYEASGINWSAEYTLVVHPDSQAEFTGWITLGNQSGKTFKDAALALVAPPQSAPAQYEERDGLNTNKLKKPFSSISNFGKRKSPKPLVSTQNTSYLPRPITLVQGKDKQVRITHATFPIEQTNLFRTFVGAYKGSFQGSHSDHSQHKSIDMILRWTNTHDTHHRLGIELASGSIDVLDSTKGDTFLNLRHQATLNFTRPGEEILLVTGRHSDFTGERRVTELKADVKTRTIRESVQIELKNHSKTKHQVVVEDLLWRWHNYTVSPCQPKYEDIAKGKQIMTWRLTVAPKSTETIRYTVLYSNVPHQAS